MDVVRVHEPHRVVQVGVHRDAHHERQDGAEELGGAEPARRPARRAPQVALDPRPPTPASTSTAASRASPPSMRRELTAARGEVDVGVDRDDRRHDEAQDEQAFLGPEPPQAAHRRLRGTTAAQAPARRAGRLERVLPPGRRRAARPRGGAGPCGAAWPRRRRPPKRARSATYPRRCGAGRPRALEPRAAAGALGAHRLRLPGVKPGTVARSIGDGSSFWMSCSRRALGVGRQRDRLARQSGPAGAADAVDVVLGDQRQVEVHDQRQLLDVEPARGHVGGHEHATRGRP